MCRKVERRQPESCRFNSPETKKRWAGEQTVCDKQTENWESERFTASPTGSSAHSLFHDFSLSLFVLFAFCLNGNMAIVLLDNTDDILLFIHPGSVISRAIDVHVIKSCGWQFIS